MEYINSVPQPILLVKQVQSVTIITQI